VKVVSHAIEELERRSDELTVLAQKAFAVAEIEVVIQAGSRMLDRVSRGRDRERLATSVRALA